MAGLQAVWQPEPRLWHVTARPPHPPVSLQTTPLPTQALARMYIPPRRSHCLFTLSVQQVQPGAKTELQAEGRLTLVDLAGSERQEALLELHKESMQVTCAQRRPLPHPHPHLHPLA